MTIASKPRVTVVTHIPSPYQVELFDEIARLEKVELRVVYLKLRGNTRLWADRPRSHEAILAGENPGDLDEIVDKYVTPSDVVVVNYYRDAFSRKVLAAQRTKANPAIVFWGERPHQHALSGLVSMYRRYMLRDVLRHSGMVWGIGKLAVEAYRQEFGESVRYANIPYFSNLSRFSNARSIAANFSAAPRRFLFSGALIERKAIDLIAKCFVRLITEGHNAHLAILGAGTLEQELRTVLSAVGDRCSFLGFADWDQLPRYYAEADVLCVPSRYDGWGLVVPEGLSAGLPVISTTSTGSAVEFIRTGINGWLVSPNNEEELFQAMRDACNLNAERYLEMTKNAARSVAQHTLRDGAERFAAAVFNAQKS
jgi:glycosyltransferase involved in cell wall biosynthesis